MAMAPFLFADIFSSLTTELSSGWASYC